MKDYIQLNKSDTLKLGIKDSNGNDTGEFLEFDLEDIELPLRYQEMVEKIKMLKHNLKNQIAIIEKKQDYKGKKMLSVNEEASARAYRDFIREMAKVYDMFLGKDGVKKLLNGGNLQWTSLLAIDKLIEEQIVPHLDIKQVSIQDKIKKIYGVEEENIIE